MAGTKATAAANIPANTRELIEVDTWSVPETDVDDRTKWVEPRDPKWPMDMAAYAREIDELKVSYLQSKLSEDQLKQARDEIWEKYWTPDLEPGSKLMLRLLVGFMAFVFLTIIACGSRC
ncbi:hypothetical protein OH77DRAFT_1426031 [Trametes cingulata]|nr:hypothetical protein OH77DRAFT_1426031 [Trametes cingulata]